MNESIKEFAKPGASSGIVIVKNAFPREAPMSRAASSREVSIFPSKPLNIMADTGKNASVCTRIRPP